MICANARSTSASSLRAAGRDRNFCGALLRLTDKGVRPYMVRNGVKPRTSGTLAPTFWHGAASSNYAGALPPMKWSWPCPNPALQLASRSQLPGLLVRPHPLCPRDEGNRLVMAQPTVDLDHGKARSWGPTFAHRTRGSQPSTSLRAGCFENGETRGTHRVVNLPISR